MALLAAPRRALIYLLTILILIMALHFMGNWRRPSTILTQDEHQSASQPKQPLPLAPVGLVVASKQDDDTAWIQAPFPEWDKFVYVLDDDQAQLGVPANKGESAMAYLTYIIDHYDQLHETTIFHHAGRYQWHNDDPSYDALHLLSQLNIPYVVSKGYHNLRCVWKLGCGPDAIRLDSGRGHARPHPRADDRKAANIKRQEGTESDWDAPPSANGNDDTDQENEGGHGVYDPSGVEENDAQENEGEQEVKSTTSVEAVDSGDQSKTATSTPEIRSTSAMTSSASAQGSHTVLASSSSASGPIRWTTSASRSSSSSPSPSASLSSPSGSTQWAASASTVPSSRTSEPVFSSSESGPTRWTTSASRLPSSSSSAPAISSLAVDTDFDGEMEMGDNQDDNGVGDAEAPSQSTKVDSRPPMPTISIGGEVDWDQNATFRDVIQQLLPEISVPRIISTPSGAQFAVTRTTILQRPKAHYQRYRNWLIQTDLDNEISGQVMEKLWHIIFGRPANDCPSAPDCYCNLYGLCNLECENHRSCFSQWNSPGRGNAQNDDNLEGP